MPFKAIRLDVVVPCYMEEDALPVTIPKLHKFLSDLIATGDTNVSSFKITLVDDGSRDDTWNIISSLSEELSGIIGIRLSRNFGHQSAMLAGLKNSDGDYILTIDADLQDDLDAIHSMIKALDRGNDLALGVRNDRSTDSFLKSHTAQSYYRLLSLLGVNIIRDHADFRLMSRRSLDALLMYNEVNLFLRGIIPSIGFKVEKIYYKRQAREQGVTKYNLKKMLGLAVDGVTSFSVAPLRIISILGGLVSVFSLLLTAYVVIRTIFYSNEVVPGWASTLTPLLILGGLQLMSIGIIGEYVGKIYLETKRRPVFIIQEICRND